MFLRVMPSKSFSNEAPGHPFRQNSPNAAPLHERGRRCNQAIVLMQGLVTDLKRIPISNDDRETTRPTIAQDKAVEGWRSEPSE